MTALNQPRADKLEARIAGLAARRGKIPSLALIHTAARKPAIPSAPEMASPDRLCVAGPELIDRLSTEISSEQRAILTRRELAKTVSSAVDAYFTRHAITTNALTRRNLITYILQALLALPVHEPASANSQNRQVEIAKLRIQPLILERMDATTAADMPRAAFEMQLISWVKEL